MKDIVYMCRSIDGTIPLGFIERSIELARIQAYEYALDRIHLWVKPRKATQADPDDSLLAVLWSADETPPTGSHDPEDYAYLGVFTTEPIDRRQRLVAQSGETV